MTDPMPRKDAELPPPVGFVTRENYEALAARLADVEARYQREVHGLNNEGDPIGGAPPFGLKRRAEAAEAEVARLQTDVRTYQDIVRKMTAEQEAKT